MIVVPDGAAARAIGQYVSDPQSLLDGLPSHAHGVRHAVEAIQHPVEHVVEDRQQVATSGGAADRALPAQGDLLREVEAERHGQ
jgi:hypothetical protein